MIKDKESERLLKASEMIEIDLVNKPIDILIKNNIPYQTQVTFNDLKNIKPLRFDFGIYDKNTNQLIRLVEFDGIQHFKPQNYFTHSLEETQKSDKIKNKYAKKNNIPLVRIPYTERDKITL